MYINHQLTNRFAPHRLHHTRFPERHQRRNSLRFRSVSLARRRREFFQMRYLQESSFLSATAQMSPSDKAAKIIQDMWRGCSGVKIFKFYRDLINFR